MIRYGAICLATLVLVVGGAAVRDWSRWRNEVLPVPGGASLSISGPSFSQRNQAVLYAGAISAAGHPAFVRLRPEEHKYQVLVGPFVTSGEAQAAQRALARRGLADTRLFVDESLRTEASAPTRWWRTESNGPRLVAAASPGILSLVIEMPRPPREVLAQRTGMSRFDVEVSPVAGDFAEGRWSAPQGTLLLNYLETSRVEDRMRVRLNIPREAISRVRLEGARVYIDLAWPDAPWPIPGAAPRVLRARAEPAPAPRAQEIEEARAAAMQEAISRFRQVQPFLLSAVDQPEPQVLAAVARTLDDLSGALPQETNGQPVRLRQAIAMARAAASDTFAGDRAVQARRAIELFDAVAGTAQEPEVRQ